MKNAKNPILIRLAIILMCTAIAAGSIAWARKDNPHYRWTHWSLSETDATTVAANPNVWLIVDARSEADYQAGHIEGALSLGDHNWDEGLGAFLERWQPESPVLIYCGGQACGSSKQVALRLLEDIPDMKVSVLKGGYPAWEAELCRQKCKIIQPPPNPA